MRRTKGKREELSSGQKCGQGGNLDSLRGEEKKKKKKGGKGLVGFQLIIGEYLFENGG